MKKYIFFFLIVVVYLVFSGTFGEKRDVAIFSFANEFVQDGRGFTNLSAPSRDNNLNEEEQKNAVQRVKSLADNAEESEGKAAAYYARLMQFGIGGPVEVVIREVSRPILDSRKILIIRTKFAEMSLPIDHVQEFNTYTRYVTSSGFFDDVCYGMFVPKDQKKYPFVTIEVLGFDGSYVFSNQSDIAPYMELMASDEQVRDDWKNRDRGETR